MMPGVPYPQVVTMVPPPKIQAAMDFLRFAHELETCQNYGGILGEEWKKEGGRKLSKNESRVYDAALSTLAEYFNTDGFGDPHAGRPQPPDGGTAPQRQPA